MSSKNKIFKHICSSAICLSMFTLAGYSVGQILNVPKQAYASSVSTIAIKNASFNEGTKTTYPFDSSYYKAYSGNTAVGSEQSYAVDAGIINLKDSKYISLIDAVRPGYDDYVLMIKSDEFVNFGYRMSDNITLSANSHYLISVDVYTDVNSPIADLYLYSNDEVYSSILNTTSLKGWTTCSFLISTGSESMSVKLGMYLNGKGTVLFDEINAQQVSKEYLESSKVGVYTLTEEKDNKISDYTFSPSADKKFVSTSRSSQIKLNGEGNGNNATIETITETDGNKALKISIDSDKTSYAQFSTDDDFINLGINSTYKLTVKAKVKNLNGNVNFQLVRTKLNGNDVDEDSSYNTQIKKVTSSTSSSLNNDYELFSFYIRSDSTKPTSFKLVAGLGSSDALSSGELYIEEISLSNITYSAFNSASSSDKLDLMSHEYVDDYLISNGDFNASKIENVENPFPSTPENWEVIPGTGTQYYGVINSDTSIMNQLKTVMPDLLNPNSVINSIDSTSNNVLLMYNKNADSLSYKSAKTTLAINGNQKLYVQAYAFNAPLKVSVATESNGTELILATEIVEKNQTKTIGFDLSGANQSLDVYLKITLDTDDQGGYAYIDHATKNSVYSGLENLTICSVDLSNPFLTSTDGELVAFTSNSDKSHHELISDVQSSSGSLIINEEHRSEFESLGNVEALAIHSNLDDKIDLTSNIGYTLTANKYYILNVSVYTQNITTETDKTKFGAGISLSSFEQAFTNITSDGKWTTYSFYLNPESNVTTYLTFSLGKDDALCSGEAFFGNITWETEDTNANIESRFDAIKNSDTVQILKTVKTESENESTNTDTNNTNKINWWYLIPSIIFPLAIVICIVGVILKKIKWKKHGKKSKNSYDRTQTVNKQFYERKAYALREEKLHDLEKEKEKLVKDRTSYEEDYKQNLTKLRELKIKRAGADELKKVEKEMKKNQKLSASVGVALNRVQSEIDYVKTDAFISSTVKKLTNANMNKPVSTPAEKETNK